MRSWPTSEYRNARHRPDGQVRRMYGSWYRPHRTVGLVSFFVRLMAGPLAGFALGCSDRTRSRCTSEESCRSGRSAWRSVLPSDSRDISASSRSWNRRRHIVVKHHHERLPCRTDMISIRHRSILSILSIVIRTLRDGRSEVLSFISFVAFIDSFVGLLGHPLSSHSDVRSS